jgi:hypothetical protein
MDMEPSKHEPEESHCGYYHDEDGICLNRSCRTSNPECKEEWEWCDECEGKGYHKPYDFEQESEEE